MNLILSYLDHNSQLKIAAINPDMEVSDGILQILNQVMEEHLQPRCFEEIISALHGNFVNYIFNIESKWNPETCETLMITGILDEHENPKIFENDFHNFIISLKKSSRLYKALYLESEKHDPEIPAQKAKLQDLVKKFYIEFSKKLNSLVQGLASLIVLGISAVGKSSIIYRLVNGKFNDNVRPTLAPQLLKMVFEKMDFRVHDVGGQVKLRSKWKTVCPTPNSIVFVIDASSNQQLHEEAAAEFKDMMNFYFHEQKIPDNTPVLLLANKIDLNPDFSIDLIENLYNPKEILKNHKIQFTSALTGEGLEDGFKWLVKNSKLTQKFM